MPKTTQLTLIGKVVIFLLIIGVVGVGLYFTGSLDSLLNEEEVVTKSNSTPIDEETVTKNPKLNVDELTTTQSTQTKTTPVRDENIINLSLDEWVGWKSIFDANGGLKTKPGSIYDKLGIKVNISIINDATHSSNSLISGKLDGAGYTVNRYAFLYNKFMENNTPVVMPYITNQSTGGDGIIANTEIQRVEDLVGYKIGVPRFSEAQTLVEWLLAKSNLTSNEINQIRNDMVYFDTPDDAARAFFAGEVDAAATWQPFLADAKMKPGTHVLFDTTISNNIILDGIVFRKDFIDENKELIAKFIEGTLKAESLYETEMGPIKNMPLFSTWSNKNIIEATADATLSNYSKNIELFDGITQTLFEDMSNIWLSIGENAMPKDARNAFDDSILKMLSDKFEVAKSTTPTFTQEQRESVQKQSNNSALLTKRATINFESGSANFANQEEALITIKEFADIAKILDNTLIQIEGNTDSVGSDELNKELSFKRAQAIATYLKFQNIDSSRFIIVGNGEDNPIASNDTNAGRAENRRTEIFFKTLN
ncbi:MAG: phosphate ABC transporter substrate-binding/OmpA family protein [archaeon]